MTLPVGHGQGCAGGWEIDVPVTGAMSPELGHVYQDGGTPVHGIARSIDEAHWDEVARRFLLT